MRVSSLVTMTATSYTFPVLRTHPKLWKEYIATVPLFSPSGTVKALEQWRFSGLRACKVPSSVALKVTPCGQSGHEMAKELMMKFSCREGF